MAILHVTELQQLDSESKGRDVMVGRFPPVTHQTVDFTSGETDSSAFNGKTRFVRLWSDVDAYIAFGDTPTASSSTIPLTAKVAEYFGVQPGDKVSALAQ